jgi:hypothetical protein
MIFNDNPITTSVFNGYWITTAILAFPTGTNNKGYIRAEFAPYDGTHVLASGEKVENIYPLTEKMTATPSLAAAVNAAKATATRLSKKSATCTRIGVSAPAPGKQARVTFMFDDKSVYAVPDAFDLMTKDADFASVFTNTMNEIAKQAGLQIG